jgi:hypothetical protein
MALRKLVFLILIGLVVLQLIRPSIPTKPATSEIQAPLQVKQILSKDCYSCHSDQRRLSWFDQIVPGYWLVRHDVLTAREHLDFSTLGSKPAAVQKATLYEAVNMIRLGAMPLPSFQKLHPEARVTPEELATLEAYLAPWTAAPKPLASGERATDAVATVPAPVNLSAVQPEFNGVPFDSGFETWKLISTTDRGDNNTFRFILGNDIAVRAARLGNISPWPDGTRFAKIAWQQEPGSDGLVHPGKFVQVELMLKDAGSYKDTEGWGWGRWRSLDLKPYGHDASFVNECTSCHLPVRGDDYVYTLPVTGASAERNEVVNNKAANLRADLPWQPLEWNPVTMYVDPNNHSTATLFGNEVAIRAVQPRSPNQQAPAYPAGAILALVTWSQREDPHWFGARIPDVPRSVEFVEVAAGGQMKSYRRFAGAGLLEDRPTTMDTQRARFILGLTPASLP